MISICLPSLAVIGTLAILLTLTPSASTAPAGTWASFKGPIGLQLYSLRNQFAADVPGTLAKVQGFGIQYVELAGTCGLTPAQFKAQLDAHGLIPVGGHFPFDGFRTNLDGIVRDAKTLGLDYVGCAWIPHNDAAPFDEKTCRDAIAVFNKAGETLSKHGLRFFYHAHGYEFVPFANGTLFNLLMAETNPKHVSFQMDVFWIVHPGQDPVKLLNTYGKRWRLMHLKGMKAGTPTGLLTGHTDVANDVALGTGKIDYAPILRAARKAGVKWYSIEDESPSSIEQIPQSLRYLETVAF